MRFPPPPSHIPLMQSEECRKLRWCLFTYQDRKYLLHKEQYILSNMWLNLRARLWLPRLSWIILNVIIPFWKYLTNTWGGILYLLFKNINPSVFSVDVLYTVEHQSTETVSWSHITVFAAGEFFSCGKCNKCLKAVCLTFAHIQFITRVMSVCVASLQQPAGHLEYVI